MRLGVPLSSSGAEYFQGVVVALLDDRSVPVQRRHRPERLQVPLVGGALIEPRRDGTVALVGGDVLADEVDLRESEEAGVGALLRIGSEELHNLGRINTVVN